MVKGATSDYDEMNGPSRAATTSRVFGPCLAEHRTGEREMPSSSAAWATSSSIGYGCVNYRPACPRRNAHV